MGQGYSLTTLSAGSAGIDVPELADLHYEKSLGTARFMKSIRARQEHGKAVVKVVMKPYPSMKLDPYVKALIHERKLLDGIPNALGYLRILETATGGYLVRQYIHSSLYDRMSTRPFLEDIEKKWISFQLLCALRDCHSQDVFHGDIKTENVLVTSWNWLYLSDFSSSFKPTFLPEDNPADFSFYFDTSGRRTCYLAPERFLVAGEEPGSRGLNWAMDIFSAGCVIAELFLESSIFSLSQLFKYRKGEYSPEHTHLNKIEDRDVRELILHMIQVDPESRYSAEEYLNFWRRKAFPEYFYSFLHQYMGLITDSSPAHLPLIAPESRPSEPDDRIDRIFLDFDKVCYFLGDHMKTSKSGSKAINAGLTSQVLPVYVDLPNARHQVGRRKADADDGTLLFLTLLVSSVRNTSKASARIRACDILLALAERIPDEAKLDRILPYIITLLNDQVDEVRAAAIRTLAQLLDLVQVVSPVNAYIFPEYIFPRLQSFIISGNFTPSPTIRAAYASCIASLAQTSLRILDMVQALRADVRLPALLPTGTESRWTEELTYQNLYDVARVDLLDFFEVHTKALLTDSNASVRRAFLGSVASLCVFFGNLKANDVILSYLNTYLNDKDWILKCAFFETVVGVAVYVGSTSLEEFILPLMIQSMTDPEEFVVEKVLRSLSSMADLGLFQRSTTWQLMYIISRFTIHPSLWLREAAIHFIEVSTKHASAADKQCIILPILRPFLRTIVTDFSETHIIDGLKTPLPKNILDMSVLWASKVEKGLFWRTAAQDRVFTIGGPEGSSPAILSRKTGDLKLHNVAKNEEDEQWLFRLQNLGLGQEDELKLLALREYIWKVAYRSKEAELENTPLFNAIIPVTQHGANPQTVFFDKKQGKQRNAPKPKPRNEASGSKPHTIADALLDASATIETPSTKRKSRSSLPKDVAPSSLPKQVLDTGRHSSQDQSPLSSSPSGKLDSQNSSAPTSDVERQLSLRTNTGNAVTPDRLSPLPSVRHRSSAIGLLNKGDKSKAFAETSTTSMNAVGKVDGPFNHPGSSPSPLSFAKESTSQERPRQEYQVNHTYKGNDPTVLRLLDTVFLENFPTDLFEFGPVVNPISARQPIKKGNGQDWDKPWQPQGTLVTLFGEHSGSVNRVVVAPDHAFFITASDDGTVKVWDTTRLEKNLTPRSRQTHRQGSKVKSITFVENTHTFVSAGVDGSIHAVKIDYQNNNDTIRYGKPQLLRQYQLPLVKTTGQRSESQQEYAIWMEHYRSEQYSTLLVATNTSKILAIDLKTMTQIFQLQNPLHHGTPTTFCFDRRHYWLVVGTSHGILDLWDLRFRVKLKAWGIPGGTMIHRLHIHPLKGRGRWICVAGGTASGAEVTVWDIEKMTCREVYRAAAGTGAGGGDTGVHGNGETTNGQQHNTSTSTKLYTAYNPDNDRATSIGNTMLSRFANVDPSNSLDPSTPMPNINGHTNTIRALAVGIDSPQAPQGPGSGIQQSTPYPAVSSSSKCAFMITGGSDRMARYWDLVHPEASKVYSGLDETASSSSHTTAATTDSTTTTSAKYKIRNLSADLILATETLPQLQQSSSNTDTAQRSKNPRRRGGTNNNNNPSTGASPRPSRSTVISLQQQLLLKRHLDEVLDVAVLERPYGMCVSVDRSGGVYVFS